MTQEKPTKKKRKRCGECGGCQKKDNCGECAPCRNEKSHQICKVRRCDRLTEKKVGLLLYYGQLTQFFNMESNELSYYEFYDVGKRSLEVLKDNNVLKLFHFVSYFVWLVRKQQKLCLSIKY